MTPEQHERVKRLFLEACELPHEERAQFLDKACSDELEIRREVESLLQHHHQSKTVISATSVRQASDTKLLASASGGAQRSRTSRESLGHLSHTVVRAIHRELGPKGLVALGVLVTAVMAIAGGVWLHVAIRNSMRQIRAEELRVHLDAAIAALEHRFELEHVKLLAIDRATELPELLRANESNEQMAVSSEALARVRSELQRLLKQPVEFTLWTSGLRVLVDSERPKLRGRSPSTEGATILSQVLNWRTHLRVPHQIDVTLASDDEPSDKPIMSAVVPVWSVNGQECLGAVVIRGLGQEAAFFTDLQRIRPGGTGETYAFNKEGLMISESRFDQQLRKLGVIEPSEDSRSCLKVQIRDPGGNMLEGYRPSRSIAARPLTTMAQFATAGEDGSDVVGYADYRGVPVIGAWKWLPSLGFGIATEIDYAEAYAPLVPLDRTMVGMVVLLVLVVGLFLSWIVRRVWARRGPQTLTEVGNYQLQRTLGQGGMGTVYLAQHAMLKRPTAVKLLKPDQVNDNNLAWFEREAQLASRLTHPNTVEIYDYGRTDSGLFFYAMEYLAGINLAELISMTGSLPSDRAIFLLRQICCSLREAHDLGLVHRDIKPQNIMICCRSGECDVIKVLDFGLAKPVEEDAASRITKLGGLVGTPMYIAPERLRNPDICDPRVDIYALGAVGFFLLCGREVFVARTEAELLHQTLSMAPPRPSSIARDPIPTDLDELIFDCLAKDPRDRPQSISEIIAVLDAAKCGTHWGQSTARRWWKEYEQMTGEKLAM